YLHHTLNPSIQHSFPTRRSSDLRANPALHRFEIDFTQSHAAARDKFVLVQALPGDLEFGANQLLNKPVLGRARKGCPSRLARDRSEEHTSELQSRSDLVCRLLLE